MCAWEQIQLCLRHPCNSTEIKIRLKHEDLYSSWARSSFGVKTYITVKLYSTIIFPRNSDIVWCWHLSKTNSNLKIYHYLQEKVKNTNLSKALPFKNNLFKNWVPFDN